MQSYPGYPPAAAVSAGGFAGAVVSMQSDLSPLPYMAAFSFGDYGKSAAGLPSYEIHSMPQPAPAAGGSAGHVVQPTYTVKKMSS